MDTKDAMDTNEPEGERDEEAEADGGLGRPLAPPPSSPTCLPADAAVATATCAVAAAATPAVTIAAIFASLVAVHTHTAGPPPPCRRAISSRQPRPRYDVWRRQRAQVKRARIEPRPLEPTSISNRTQSMKVGANAVRFIMLPVRLQECAMISQQPAAQTARQRLAAEARPGLARAIRTAPVRTHLNFKPCPDWWRWARIRSL